MSAKNSEKISSAGLEKLIGDTCHYAKQVVICKDENGNHIALIFPEKKLLSEPDYHLTPGEGCFCPRTLEELGKCLSGCLKLVNQKIENDLSKIKSAAIINTQLPNEGETKNGSDAMITKYKTLLHSKNGNHVSSGEEIYFIKIN